MSLTPVVSLNTLHERLTELYGRSETLLQVPDAYAVLARAKLAGRRSETREMQTNYEGEVRALLSDIIAAGDYAKAILSETQKKLKET